MKEKERETEIALKRKRWRWGSCSKLGWEAKNRAKEGRE